MEQVGAVMRRRLEEREQMSLIDELEELEQRAKELIEGAETEPTSSRPRAWRFLVARARSPA